MDWFFFSHTPVLIHQVGCIWWLDILLPLWKIQGNGNEFSFMSIGNWFNKEGECCCFLRFACIASCSFDFNCLRCVSKVQSIYMNEIYVLLEHWFLELCIQVIVIIWNFISLEGQCMCNKSGVCINCNSFPVFSI